MNILLPDLLIQRFKHSLVVIPYEILVLFVTKKKNQWKDSFFCIIELIKPYFPNIDSHILYRFKKSIF